MLAKSTDKGTIPAITGKNPIGTGLSLGGRLVDLALLVGLSFLVKNYNISILNYIYLFN